MKKLLSRRNKLAIATSVALGLSMTAMADDTASSIKGRINLPTTADNSSTVITIVHEASGLKRTVSVNESGDYSIRGLRVGGPYKLTIDTVSFDDRIIGDIYLNQGSNDLGGVTIANQQVLEEVVTVGTVTDMSIAGGNSFGEDRIMSSASIARDLKDTVKRDPFASINGDNGALSIAGSNPKMNSLVVDGIKQNDDFGLEASGYPTLRSPISLDAVESVAVNTSPMSVKYGGFSGGQVSVTVKSGTNEVDGSVFYEHSSDSIAGDAVPLEYEEDTYGGTIGFPILEDKVFGFISYEKYESPQSAEYGPIGAGYGEDSQSGVTLAELQEIQQIAADVYGIDNIGTYAASPTEEDEKILAKFDWYINDDHRASITYQNTEGNSTKGLTTYSDGDLNLSSRWYNETQTLETYVANLYSDWSDDFSTDLKIGYKDSAKTSSPILPLGIGQVTVNNANRDGVVFGTERFRQANRLSNKNLEVRLEANYFVGDHQILFGGVYNDLDIFNVFAADAMGTWEFASIDDFRNGVVDRFDYQGVPGGSVDDAAGAFKMQTYTFFIEDQWAVNDDLDLTFGLRYETISMPDSPVENQNFINRYGYSNTATFDGKDVVLPRFGFTYQLTDDTEISGGVGRFAGGYPNVWMANSYQNDGTTLLTLNTGWDQAWGRPDFGNISQDTIDALPDADGTVNALDPNFEIPTDWRYLLEVKHYFSAPVIGDDWLVGLKAEYRQKENDVAWQELNREYAFTGEDGRVIYEPNSQHTDFLLTNATKDGQSTVLAVYFDKEWDNGISLYTSYTNTDVDEGNLGSSSRAVSNYQYPVVQFDRNASTVGRGGYMNEHRFTMSLDWKAELFSGLDTTVGLFWEIKSGRPMSWVMGSYRDTGFGDQGSLANSSAYLPYIPDGANDPLVNYGYGLDYDTLMEAVEELGLDKYAGSIIPKGTHDQPWIRSLDLHFSQEIPGFSDDHKGVLYFDIQNVLNLMNDEWGIVRYQNFGTKKLVDMNYDPTTGTYTYSVPYGQSGLETHKWNSTNAKQSNWRMKLGVRYRF